MFDDYNCSRCGEGYKWERMVSTSEGDIFCPNCWPKLDAKNESKRKCPVDGAEMQKRIVASFILIDTCSACGGTWFDKHELEVVERKAKEAGQSQAFFLGWMSLAL